MSEGLGAPKPGWLEIVGGPGAGSSVFCPCRGSTVALRECLACEDYASLAIDARGQRSFLVCAKVEARQLAEARATG